MNEYKIVISGTDPYGIKFLNTVVEFANKGATIDEAHPWTCKFPAKVFMNIKTKEYLETDILSGVQVMPISIIYTKEMLDALEWTEFKDVVKKRGVGGRDRAQMVRQYLEATQQEGQRASEAE